MVNHFLVPKHRKLSEKEVTSLLIKYSITKNQLPKIKINDPALKEFDVEIGDVIEIERRSFAGKSYYYRMVEE